jgi:hypothetical protein
LSGSLADLITEESVFPSVDADHIPSLKMFVGLGCNHCEYTTKDQGKMQHYYNVKHALTRRSRGGLKSIAKGRLLERLSREHYGDIPPWSPVSYQRFFTSVTANSRCFRIKTPA